MFASSLIVFRRISSDLRKLTRSFAGVSPRSVLLRVQGSVLASVPQVEVILVERELVVFHDPTLPARAVDGLCPVAWSYDLVWSLLRGDAGDRPTYVQYFRVGAVTPDGFAVYPAYIGGPAIVVCVGQAACAASELHTQSLPLNSPLSSKSPSGSAAKRILSIL
jgi:hypothetical protein